jgi:hypothetical protein
MLQVKHAEALLDLFGRKIGENVVPLLRFAPTAARLIAGRDSQDLFNHGSTFPPSLHLARQRPRDFSGRAPRDVRRLFAAGGDSRISGGLGRATIVRLSTPTLHLGIYQYLRPNAFAR